MMQNQRVGDAAVIIIFCVFILSVFTTLILSVRTYQHINEASLEGYDDRIGVSYIWTKIKTGDDAGRLYAGGFHGLSALYIDEELDGAIHHTIIYHYEGWIYELFCETGYEFSPRDGMPIVKNDSLLIQQAGNSQLQIVVGKESIVVSPRS